MPLSSPLADPRALTSSARKMLVGASALASGVLAPLVLAFVFLGAVPYGRLEPSAELALWALWASGVAALLGGRAVGSALDAPGWNVVARATLAGALYPILVFAPWVVVSIASRGFSFDGLGGFLIVTAIAAFLGACCGVAFGGMFAVGVARVRMQPAAHDLPDRAALAGAAMLAIAVLLIALLAAGVEGAYCQALFFVVLPTLDVAAPPCTDAAWT
nr:hypothetical protein [Myxococcota bacterium]